QLEEARQAKIDEVSDSQEIQQLERACERAAAAERAGQTLPPGQSYDELRERLNRARREQADPADPESRNPIRPRDIPGLRIHVCTLVAPDALDAAGWEAMLRRNQREADRPAAAGQGYDWPFVYIHSKLMIINDVFMTQGSANINTRSMRVDSELNICHERGDISAG
ncbi:phospholipase D-like domain-containing protein, partial [Chromobacterium sp. Panama]|uniref:phospholipase D-like domain-containing protein n=1 Tax=Chromobacterium sp. Panama TaxID=2161826 RepID=UPI0018EE4F7E